LTRPSSGLSLVGGETTKTLPLRKYLFLCICVTKANARTSFFKRQSLDYPQHDTPRSSRKFVNAMKPLHVSRLFNYSRSSSTDSKPRTSSQTTRNSTDISLTSSEESSYTIRQSASPPRRPSNTRGLGSTLKMMVPRPRRFGGREKRRRR